MARIRDHRSNRYKSGDSLALCQRTGRTVYASELRREWTGLLVHYSVYEPKHPQLMVRTRPDRQTAAVQSPEGADVDVGSFYVDGEFWGVSYTGVS